MDAVNVRTKLCLLNKHCITQCKTHARYKEVANTCVYGNIKWNHNNYMEPHV